MKEYGKLAKELRERQNISLSRFEEIGISKGTISNFESGKSMLSFDKMLAYLGLLGISVTAYLSLLNDVSGCKRYGQVFKNIREQREISVDFFQDLEISAFELENFESGKIMLDFEKINQALQLMHVSLADFDHLLNEGQEEYFIELFEKIENADSTNDQTSLQAIYKEAQKFPEFRLIELSAKNYLQGLDRQDQAEIGDFLFGVEVWTTYELSVFLNTIDSLSVNLSLSILNDFYKNYARFDDEIAFRQIIIRITVKLSLRLMDEGEKFYARQILKDSKKLLSLKDTYTGSIHMFAVGYYNYTFENKAEGLYVIEKVIGHFRFIEDFDTARELEFIFNRIRE